MLKKKKPLCPQCLRGKKILKLLTADYKFRDDSLLKRYFHFLLAVFLTSLFAFPILSYGLEADEVLVIANSNAEHSVSLAKHYMEKRGVPEENLIKLSVTDSESMDREEYEEKVAKPVRGFLEGREGKKPIRCLLIMYGMPLKVGRPKVALADLKKAAELKAKQILLENKLKGTQEGLEKEKEAIKAEIAELKKRSTELLKSNYKASLDSEIALVLSEEYSLANWIPNPFFTGYGDIYQDKRDEVFMVSRLDGPVPEIVKRVIDESIQVEKTGLKGKTYFDARWVNPKKQVKEWRSYAFYDQSIHKSAKLVRESGIMPVVIDKKSELFQPGDCPDAALYCGWYSLRKYVDAFTWKPGSIGYHIASGECTTLRKQGSQVWCKRMLEEGVAATLGPVNEPYVHGFPVPELFFKYLIDGYYSLAEVYALSQPFWSWQMVLIGDPLYRPFMNRKQR